VWTDDHSFSDHHRVFFFFFFFSGNTPLTLKLICLSFSDPDLTESIDQTEPLEDEQNEEDESSRAVYLCGNSLGLQNRRTAEMMLAELDVWADQFATLLKIQNSLPLMIIFAVQFLMCVCVFML
jgi:hypothetical protein